MNTYDMVETISELPVASGHLPSYQKLLDTAIDLSFPASDPPAISACSRCADEPLSSNGKAGQPPKGKMASQEGAEKQGALHTAEEMDWALEAEHAEDIE